MSHSCHPMPVTLHLLCGKIAAGKPTLARKPSAAPQTLLLSEDRWLTARCADRMNGMADYLRCSGRLWKALKEVISSTGRRHQRHCLAVPEEGFSLITSNARGEKQKGSHCENQTRTSP